MSLAADSYNVDGAKIRKIREEREKVETEQ